MLRFVCSGILGSILTMMQSMVGRILRLAAKNSRIIYIFTVNSIQGKGDRRSLQNSLQYYSYLPPDSFVKIARDPSLRLDTLEFEHGETGARDKYLVAELRYSPLSFCSIGTYEQ